MLIFRFVPVEADTVIDFLTRGHIVVTDDQTEHFPTNTAQPLLLLYAVHELLSGVLDFFNAPSDKQYIFQSMYGDDGVKVTRNRRQVLSVYAWGHQNHLIAQTTPEQFRLALWQGVEQLFSEYVLPDEQDGNDFGTIVDTREELNAHLQQWIATFPELPPIVISRL